VWEVDRVDVPDAPQTQLPAPRRQNFAVALKQKPLHRRHLIAEPNLVRDQREGRALRARRVAGVVRGQTLRRLAIPREPEREQRAQSEQRNADAVETPKALAAGFAGNARAGAAGALHVVRIGHQGDSLLRRWDRGEEV
jgi:hypothetical protein